MKALVKTCVAFAMLVMLVLISVKIAHIEDRFELMTRPARLFNPHMVQSKFAPRPEWEVEISPDHDRFFYVLAQQPLYWLGRGMQVYVFETQDKKYVVKFFQLGRIRERDKKGFLKKLVSKETESKRKERLDHREEIFSSSKMCYENLREETGFVYVHLNRTDDILKGLKLIDFNGQSHRIRGDDASFVVQKKASYVIPTLTSLMDRHQVVKAKKRIDQIFDLLLALAKKGYVDGDDALIRNNNMGFTEGRAIYLDTGHIFKADNLDVLERMRYEFQVRLEPLEKWLNVMYPVLGEYYSQKREELLASLA